MALTAGTCLGPYEIQGLIGAGGMGEVYKARDARLGRSVAIKIVPAEAAADPDRRRRFEQEARAASALNHPHICVLHDIGSTSSPRAADGGTVDYLVMEYLEGQTLAERLAKGPLPVAQALDCAVQIADALAAAHRAGIVHRDLKPANVMITKAGVKLLDFGLARLMQPASASGASATLSASAVIVGTLPYMAPEQVQGRATDSRTDIFAFGAVLYEMLTGKRAFTGESQATVIAAILERDPAPLSSLQPPTPPALDRIVTRCLAKDPDARWQSAADLADELGWLQAARNGPKSDVPGRRGVRRPWVAAALVAVWAAGVACGVALWRAWFVRTASALHFEVSIAGTGLAPPEGVAISPDGDTIVFRAGEGTRSRLYVRDLHESTTRPLEGTEGADSPCLSPDGDWVAFVSHAGLQRVALGGGPPVTIYASARSERVPVGSGVDWEADDRISFTNNGQRASLWRVSARGGEQPELLGQAAAGNPGLRAFSPQALAGGRAFLFTAVDRGRSSIVAFRLDDDRRWRTVIDGASRARYVPATGLLFYQADGNLYAVAFDPERLTVRGRAYPVVERVGNSLVSVKEYDISQTGALAYLPALAATLMWKDRHGVVTPLPARVEGQVGLVSLSPDGRRAVFGVQKGAAQQLYAADLGTDAALTRLTDGNADPFGVFTPDGRQVVFTSAAADGRYNIFSRRADGGGEPTRQTNSASWQKPSSVGPGPLGDIFLFNQLAADGRFDIWQQRMGRADTARPLVRTSADEVEAVFSPDGRWIAYESDISGDYEVYVQGYPDGPVTSVSPGGGNRPLWNPKGGELFYQKSTRVFAVRVVNGARVGPPTPVFDRPNVIARNWAVAPDGERFLVAENVRAPHINIVRNWFEELKAKGALAAVERARVPVR